MDMIVLGLSEGRKGVRKGIKMDEAEHITLELVFILLYEII
jgi:hypothetical protein